MDKTHIRQAFVSSLLPHWVHSCTLQRDELPEEQLAELSPAWKLYLYTLLVCFTTYKLHNLLAPSYWFHYKAVSLGKTKMASN